jgi:hypothetical protein
VGLAFGALIALISAVGGTLLDNGLVEGELSLAVAATLLYLAFSVAATLPLLVILRTRISRTIEEVRS